MEFVAKYDAHALSEAAIQLFLHRWRPLLPWPAVGLSALSLLVGAICFYADGPLGVTTVFLSLGVLSVVACATLFVLHRRRVMSRDGDIARVLLGEQGVRVEVASGQAEVLWKDIAEIEIGTESVLLFVSRGVALMLPKGSVPAAAMDEIVRRKQESI